MTGGSRREFLRRGAALAAGTGALAALAGCTGPSVDSEVSTETPAYAVTEHTDWWAGSFTGQASVHVVEGRLRTEAGEPTAPPDIEATYYGPDGTELGTASAVVYDDRGRPYGQAGNPLPDSFGPESVHRFKLTFEPGRALARYVLRVR